MQTLSEMAEEAEMREAGRLTRFPDDRPRNHFLSGDGWHTAPIGDCPRCKAKAEMIKAIHRNTEYWNG